MWRFNPSRLSPLYIVERVREEMIGNAKLNAHQQTRPQATSIKRDHKICESFHQTQLFCHFRKCNSGKSLPTTSTSISSWKDFGVGTIGLPGRPAACRLGSQWLPVNNLRHSNAKHQLVFSNAEKSWTATTTSHDATGIKESSSFVY